ncbi:hypothetical protein [uncultured Tateyamaria sp.]|uniref:hypothetical protein n=1 Tax=uncultured Tateyamaria sp. TaxID=455651 RepID=UPI00261CD2B0|nr:hypothetical protein [uncultured Tateyamaria sp.]
MSDPYEAFELVWQKRLISVRYQANWLSSETWHIELRCSEQLPVTETGYRSIFVPNAGFEGDAEVEIFVCGLLDEAATSKTWVQYVEDSRQLKLF